MGFSKRTGTGLPFALKRTVLVLCTLISALPTLNASVVPISTGASLPAASNQLAFGGGTLQEVTRLLAINTGIAEDMAAVGLGKILRDATAVSWNGNLALFSYDTLSGSASDWADAFTGVTFELDPTNFTNAPGIGIGQVKMGSVREAALAAITADRAASLDAWDVENVTLSSAAMAGNERASLILTASAYSIDGPSTTGPGETINATTAVKTWNGGSGSTDNWSSSNNWGGTGAPVAGDSLTFGGSTRLNPFNNLTADTSFAGITFNAGAGAFTLSGNRITLGGNVANNSTTLQTISLAMILSGNRTFTTSSGGGDLTIGGILSETGGARGITKAGAGTLTLSGANSYTGLTTVSAGVLNIRHNTGLGTIAGGTTVFSGAALQLQGGIVVGNETLTLDGTGIGSTGALRNISGDNSWAGAITINSTTRINSDSGTLTLDVASGNAITGSNDNLEFGGTGNLTINDVIATGSGTVTKDGLGTLILNAANTYTGLTTVSAGVLNIRHNTGLGTIAGGATVSSGATLQLQNNITIGNEALTIRGPGASGQNGALVNVSGTNNYGGLITLGATSTISSDSGTLNLTNLGTITGATYGLTLRGSGNGTVASIIGTGTGSLTKNGTGTWTLTGVNTYTGATTINGGTLTLASSSGIALGFTSGITVNSGGTLLLGANNQINNLASLTLAGGTFARGNFSEGSTISLGLGALNLTAAGSHLDFGTGTVGIITFASFVPGSFTLTIDNWTGTANTMGTGLTDRLIFASSQSGNLSRFDFTGFAPGAVAFDLGGGYWEIVPVPEAETYFSGLIVLALILLHHRKQLRTFVRRHRASSRPCFSAAHGTGVAS